MKYKFTKDYYETIVEDCIFMFNTFNGHSIKLSKECYDVVLLGITNKKDHNDVIFALEDAEDKKYFHEVYKLLIEYKIIVDKCNLENSEIDSISLSITHRCNLSCIHCCNNAAVSETNEYLSTVEMIEIIDRIIELNPKNISITGGEPLVREDLYILLEHIKTKYEGQLLLMTNGTLINAKNIDFLVSTFYGFDISLDGYDEESCGKIRGKGVFTKVINTVQLLQSHDVKHISLSAVETRHLHGNSDKFIELANKLGTQYTLRLFSPTDRGKANEEELQPFNENVSDDERKSIIKKAKEINDKNIEKKRGKSFSCGAGRREISITEKGNVYPCQMFQEEDYLLGNILEDYFIEELLNAPENLLGMKNLHKLFPQNVAPCSECDLNMFCYRCPGIIRDVRRTPEYFDFRCNNLKFQLKNMLG